MRVCRVTCPVLVERSENDYDAHGRFTRRWQESCGAPIHAHGMCLHHFNCEVSKTRVEIHCCRDRVARAEQRLRLLLDSGVCAGTGAERISRSA